MSVRTKTPRWLVLRLSICLRKTAVQRSLQRNFIVSRGSVREGRGRLAVRLRDRAGAAALAEVF